MTDTPDQVPPAIQQLLDVLPEPIAVSGQAPGWILNWLYGACDEDEASEITGEPTATLQTKRVRGGGPPFKKAGKSVRYIRRDLLAYNYANRRISTSDPGQPGPFVSTSQDNGR